MPKRTSIRDSELLRDLERVARRLQRERGEPPPPRVSNHDLLEDLLRVARKLRKPTVHALTAAEYDAHGRHSSSTFRMRFGSWREALEMAARPRPKPIAMRRRFEDWGKVLQRAGLILTAEWYGEHGRYRTSAIVRRFGSWRAALARAGLLASQATAA